MKNLRLRTFTVFAVLFTFVVAGKAEQPAPVRVFVCAHSFMIFTSKLLPNMAQAAGFPYTAAGQQMLGGSRVIQHWNLPDNRNLAKAALREGKVDILTLSPHRQLPDEGIDNFTKLGLEKNKRLRVFVQASWPGFDGVWTGFKNEQRNAATLDSLREMRRGFHELWLTGLEAQVRTLNQSVGQDTVHIVPVCDAVFALREHIAKGTAPGLTKQTDLFYDDIGHAKPALAGLVGYCHFAAISGRTPVGLPVPAELQNLPQAAELNTLLQHLAWEAVSTYPLSGVQAAPAAAK